MSFLRVFYSRIFKDVGMDGAIEISEIFGRVSGAIFHGIDLYLRIC